MHNVLIVSCVRGRCIPNSNKDVFKKVYQLNIPGGVVLGTHGDDSRAGGPCDGRRVVEGAAKNSVESERVVVPIVGTGRTVNLN